MELEVYHLVAFKIDNHFKEIENATDLNVCHLSATLHPTKTSIPGKS